ncbi:MAG: SsrA-binding protein SmpB [Candidatus Omnitrophica bacterium]|nr:SsrA-binding protein SmpB [Candidatus Omnitrophota bacterium]
MTKKESKVIATNRKARKNYEIFDAYEAGIALKGDEVKSLRWSRGSIEESYARVENGQAILYNMHIPEFIKSSYFKSDPRRPRKLLLHKKEIDRLWGLTSQRGYTLIPLKVYFNERGFVKIEIALAKGKLLYDKRRKIKEEYTKREARREIKKHLKG